MLHPDRSRVLLRPFLGPLDPRATRICAQVMALPEAEVHDLWQQVKMEFGGRHTKTRDFLQARFEQIRCCLPADEDLSDERQLSWALASVTSIRSKPPRCSIPPSCRIRTNPTSPPARCASS